MECGDSEFIGEAIRAAVMAGRYWAAIRQDRAHERGWTKKGDQWSAAATAHLNRFCTARAEIRRVG